MKLMIAFGGEKKPMPGASQGKSGGMPESLRRSAPAAMPPMAVASPKGPTPSEGGEEVIRREAGYTSGAQRCGACAHYGEDGMCAEHGFQCDADGSCPSFEQGEGSGAGAAGEDEEEDEDPAPSPHKFSCLMVDLPPAVAAAVRYIHQMIEDGDLVPDDDRGSSASTGIEEDPHITIKYGIHSENAEDVVEFMAQPPLIRLGKVSIFKADENRNSDVVKVTVYSVDLARMNKDISEGMDVTDTYPVYEPHLTVAYVKPGAGEKYEGADWLDGLEFEAESATFSSKSGNRNVLKFGRRGMGA